MVDIGPIMVVMVMVDIGPITVDIGPIMVVMVMVGMVVGLVVVMAMVVVIPQLRTFNDRTAHKQLRIHRPTIGTVSIRKAMLHMLEIVQTAGCRLPLSQRQLRSNQIIQIRI